MCRRWATADKNVISNTKKMYRRWASADKNVIFNKKNVQTLSIAMQSADNCTPSLYSHSKLLLAINNPHVLSIPMHSVIRRSGWCLVMKLLEPHPAAAAAHHMPNDGNGPDRGMWGGICFGSNYPHHLKRFSMHPPCKWCQWCSAAENGLMEVQGGVGCFWLKPFAMFPPDTTS